MRYSDRGTYPDPDPDRYPPHPPVAPRKRHRKWPWIVLAVLALLVVFAVSCSPTAPQQTSSGVGSTVPLSPNDDTAAPPPVTEDDAAATLTFGQPYNAAGLQLTVTAPKPGDATLGATYCTTVSYTNGTDNAVTFGIFDWKMVDTEGVESTAGFTGGKSVDSGLGQGNLRPGGKKSGQVCFDKQGAGTPDQIIYQGGLFGDPVVWHK